MNILKKLKNGLFLSSKVNKKALLVFVLGLTITTTAIAQTGTSFGIKGGLNYNANGEYFESINTNVKNPDRNIGYHVGLFGKFGDKLYLRPELVYTATKSDYDSATFSLKKLDAPVLVGINVIGPISAFGGPSFQYILDSDFEGVTIDKIENDFTVGVNFGIAVNFESFGIDLRYERGLGDNEATFLSNNNIAINDRLDTRPDQLILSVSLKI